MCSTRSFKAWSIARSPLRSHAILVGMCFLSSALAITLATTSRKFISGNAHGFARTGKAAWWFVRFRMLSMKFDFQKGLLTARRTGFVSSLLQRIRHPLRSESADCGLSSASQSKDHFSSSNLFATRLVITNVSMRDENYCLDLPVTMAFRHGGTIRGVIYEESNNQVRR